MFKTLRTFVLFLGMVTAAGCSLLFSFDELTQPGVPADAALDRDGLDVGPPDGAAPDGSEDGGVEGPDGAADADATDGQGCAPGRADCDEDAANGCETVIAGSSVVHCGACGRACAPGTGCASGICGPEGLAENQNGLMALAVDDRYVYWTRYLFADAGGGVYRIPKDGGGVNPTLLLAGRAWGLAVDDGGIYASVHSVGNTAQVVEIQKSDGGARVLYSGASAPYPLASTGNAVIAGIRAAPNSQILAQPKDGGSASLVTTISGELIQTLAANEHGAYWTNSGANATVGGMPFDASSPVVVGGQSNANYVALETDRLFWSGSTANVGVRSLPIPPTENATFNVEVRPASGAVVYGIAVDERYVYWSTATLLYRTARGSSGPHVPLVSSLAQWGNVGPVAVDSEWVYFGTTGAGFPNVVARQRK